ncbi:MAG: T9SS type B sorting domain-containing protein [Flavobacteriaceae bacterium]|nr:T9SS type B sorting domain-containing protein [Flavobacteriaceae bacterium]
MMLHKTSFCVLLFVFIHSVIAAQSAVSADCLFAVPICADVPTLGEANGSGDVDDFDPDVITESGCLEKGSIGSANIEHNTAWYMFRAGADGLVGFDIEALSTTADWDFAVYGPDVDCGNLGDPIRCNYETDNTAFTGLGNHPSPGNSSPGDDNFPYDDWLDVKEGEVYYIFINNFNTNTDGDPAPFKLTFKGPSFNNNGQSALDCSLKEAFLGPDRHLCIGDGPVELRATNSGAGADAVSYAWYYDNGSGNPVLLAGETGETLMVNSPNSGVYSVVVSTLTTTYTDEGVLVQFHDNPIIADIIVHQDLSDSNAISIQMLVAGPYEYRLNEGPYQDSPDFTNVPPGLNTVTVNNVLGCGEVSQDFLVVGYPKFFTPNRDGVYDTWHVLGIETLGSGKVFIFDRQGKLLKQLNQFSDGWDGTFNGRPMPATDYWFRFEYTREEDGLLVAKSIRAHFSLIR